MLDGLYSAAAGMDAQQQRLDAISNDLANLDTPGYQAQRVGFEDLLYNAPGAATGSGAGTGVTVGTGATVLDLGPTQVSSAVEETGNPLDVAVNGDAYLEVKQTDGTLALTRNGSLELDGLGRLTTQDGLVLQPPITVPPGTAASDISIATDGTVSIQGRTLGKLALVNVPAPEQLTSAGNSLLVANGASGAIRAASAASVLQGSLNSSNVNLATEMTQMIDAQQSYSMTSQALNIQTQMAQIANQVRQ
jgi:flagellar basal-body rod protein FlgG